MTQQSVEQDPETGLWRWYDEGWGVGGEGYRTRSEASHRQSLYARDVLGDGSSVMPLLSIGDYVWYEQPQIGITNRSPARIVGHVTEADAPDWPNNEFYIRLLTGPQVPKSVHESSLRLMADMEVVAIAASWGGSVKL